MLAGSCHTPCESKQAIIFFLPINQKARLASCTTIIIILT